MQELSSIMLTKNAIPGTMCGCIMKPSGMEIVEISPKQTDVVLINKDEQ